VVAAVVVVAVVLAVVATNTNKDSPTTQVVQLTHDKSSVTQFRSRKIAMVKIQCLTILASSSKMPLHFTKNVYK
jgi:anti-sigma-K factor RskA